MVKRLSNFSVLIVLFHFFFPVNFFHSKVIGDIVLCKVKVLFIDFDKLSWVKFGGVDNRFPVKWFSKVSLYAKFLGNIPILG